MSGTKRTPIGRPPQMQVSARAIALFEAMEKARRSRRAAACVPPGPYGHCCMQCSTCRTWWELQTQLCTELALPPWRWPAVPINPWPPGTMQSREWEPDGDEMLELWQQLERARRAARAEPTDAPDAPIRDGSHLATLDAE